MASHKDSEDFKKHVIAVHASLGDQGNSAKFHKVVEDVVGMPGYEEDILASMCMAHGEGGPDRYLTLQDVWKVHMLTQWYMDQLTGLFDT